MQGQQLLVHSAFLAAHSDFFARRFHELKHSQPLFSHQQEPQVVDSGAPGKRVQAWSWQYRLLRSQLCLTENAGSKAISTREDLLLMDA